MSQQPKKEDKDKPIRDEDLSQEDLELKQRIDEHMTNLLDGSLSKSTKMDSLQLLVNEVKQSTTTMTSVPKPFKFIKQHYQSLHEYYKANKQEMLEMSGFMSVLAMSFGEDGDSLAFLLESRDRNISEWGYNYISHISREVGQEYQKKMEQKDDKGKQELLELVNKIVVGLMESNGEQDVIDLLLEVDQLQMIIEYINKQNINKIQLYLQSCSLYNSDQEEMDKINQINYECMMKMEQYSQAVRIAIKMDHQQKVIEVLQTVYKKTQEGKKYVNELGVELDYKDILHQVCFDLSKQRSSILNVLELQDIDEQIHQNMIDIVGNKNLIQYYKQLANDLDVLEPKHPDQIYKDEQKKTVDSSKMNLANTYVNAFVHLGMGQDSLMIQKQNEENKQNNDGNWIYKLKNDGMIAGSGSIGMICMWDLQNGCENIQEYLDLKDGYVKMGAHIAVGLYSQNVYDDCDQAKAILEESLNDSDNYHSRLGSVIGLGLGYAGSCRDEFIETMVPLMMDMNNKLEMQVMTGLTMSLIFVGRRNEEVINAVLSVLMENQQNGDKQLINIYGLVLGLLFLGQQEKSEPTIEACELIEDENLREFTKILIKGCSYVESGNVLQIQEMMHIVIKNMEKIHLNDKEKKELEKQEQEEQSNKEDIQNNQQAQQDRKQKKEKREKRLKEIVDENTNIEQQQFVAMIGLGLIAGSEQIGNEMIVRQLNHIYQFGDIHTKRQIPICYILLFISNPRINIMDQLNKMSYDSDSVLSQRAIIGLGLIGLGTNNSRLGNQLRNLAWYYGYDSQFVNHLFMVKIAQGLLYSGKGLVTAQPYYSDRFLLDKVGMAGILCFMIALQDVDYFLHKQYHWLLFYLNLTIRPRMLFTVDKEFNHLPVTVRVGQAVDYVAQAGKPKKITGFQTHKSPVIISYGERAELADDYITMQENVLENIIILQHHQPEQ